MHVVKLKWHYKYIGHLILFIWLYGYYGRLEEAIEIP